MILQRKDRENAASETPHPAPAAQSAA